MLARVVVQEISIGVPVPHGAPSPVPHRLECAFLQSLSTCRAIQGCDHQHWQLRTTLKSRRAESLHPPDTLGPSKPWDEGLQKCYKAFDAMDSQIHLTRVIALLVLTPPVTRGPTAAALIFRKHRLTAPQATRPSAGLFDALETPAEGFHYQVQSARARAPTFHAAAPDSSRLWVHDQEGLAHFRQSDSSVEQHP